MLPVRPSAGLGLGDLERRLADLGLALSASLGAEDRTRVVAEALEDLGCPVGSVVPGDAMVIVTLHADDTLMAAVEAKLAEFEAAGYGDVLTVVIRKYPAPPAPIAADRANAVLSPPPPPTPSPPAPIAPTAAQRVEEGPREYPPALRVLDGGLSGGQVARFYDRDGEVRVRVESSHDKQTVTDRPVYESDAERWPAEWAAWQASQGIAPPPPYEPPPDDQTVKVAARINDLWRFR